MNRPRILLLFLMILAACGQETATRSGNDQGLTGPIDPYADPPDYSGDPFADFPQVISVSIPSEESETHEEAEEVLSGTHFTVQISAATSEETAERLAESVRAEITRPVFVDREGNYWKVRVGAFPVMQDAQEYTGVLVDMGFTDAWVTTRQ